MRCFQNHRELRPRQGCGGPRTPPSKTDANLKRHEFVEIALVFSSSKDWALLDPPHYDPLIMTKFGFAARPSSPEGSGGVATGCSNGAECSVVEDEASIKCHCPLGFVGEKCQQGISHLPKIVKKFVIYAQLPNL